ncbi:hypothetical protein EDC01DRAFT_719632 [Geopyxis carbonaria]|nr:hypothetical protein EDC01DRAFT_719632 [Geopyxis carbonaria]
MGVERIVLVPGNGVDFPRERDDVEMHYIGSLVVRGEDGNIVRDNSGAPKKGEVFDSSRNRGAPFKTKIGIGKVIKGWDEGVPQMSLGEKATLEITPDFGYGPRGFPPLIPPNSTLLL